MLRLVLLFTSITCCTCVPPDTENFWEEMNKIKSSLKLLEGQVEKLNSAYSSKIEPRIISATSTLSSIDSNIRNLQGRAHVWDTFQLHVSAWNEQLTTSDRKLDIISSAQDKILSLDNKLNSLISLEYKIDSYFKKIQNTEETLLNIQKTIQNQNIQNDNLFGEFATRGILSTLKMVERKLDKLQLLTQSTNAKQNDVSKNHDELKNKLTIKCNSPPVVEEILNDMASKVDIIFDKINVIENGEGVDYLSDQEDVEEEAENDGDGKLLRKVIKRINQPCKKTIQLLEDIQYRVMDIENNTLAIIDKNYYLLGLYKQSLKSWENGRTDSFVRVENLIRKLHEDQLTEMNKGFEGQENNCKNSNILTIFENPSIIIISVNQSSCEELVASKAKSGIYQFQLNQSDDPILNRYYTRYCEVRNDGIWTVIQRRGDYDIQHNFSLDWKLYKNGFGDMAKSFWFGNDFIYKLSQENDLILRIELEDFRGNSAWAEYDYFKIESEANNYKLHVGGYRGNASDSFSTHDGSLFSTYDRKNDNAPECCPCALAYGGGWWFNSCFESNLNGVYYNIYSIDRPEYEGIIWQSWLDNYSLKISQMMVKSKSTNLTGTSTEDDIVENQTTTTFPFIENP